MVRQRNGISKETFNYLIIINIMGACVVCNVVKIKNNRIFLKFINRGFNSFINSLVDII